MESASSNPLMASSPQPNKRPLWQRCRVVFAFVLVVGIAVAIRGIWWPRPFQAEAREALSKYENEEALKWLDWASWFAPEDVETAFLRARAYRRIGNFHQSSAALNRAELLQPKSERLQREEWLGLARSGQLRKVAPHVAALLKDPRGEKEEILEALIFGCYLNQKHAETFELLQSWVNEFPKHARPYLLRAKFWQIKSQSSKALEDLKQAVDLEPTNGDAVLELASLLQVLDEFDEAIPLFERLLNVPRLADQASVGLAICLFPRGETSRIRRLLEHASKLAPRNARVLCEYGRLDLETGHYASAVDRLKEAIRAAPRDETSHFVLAQALVADGKPDEAQPHFDFVHKVRDGMRELNRCEELLSKNPRNVEAMVTAGSILLEIMDGDEGVSRLLAALEIEPNNAVARKKLADHFERRAEANPEFRKFAERYRAPPDDP